MIDISDSDAKEIKALKINLKITKEFLDFIEKIDSLPDIERTPYTKTRSLYQAVSKGRGIKTMEKQLEEFFGVPIKPAGKPIPLLMRSNPSIKYLRGIREQQTLFIKKVKSGFYYGALMPWNLVEDNITVHLGFCGHKMSKKDYKKIEELVKTKILHRSVFEGLDSEFGGQVQGINLASFLLMAAMEKTTCTLKIQKKSDVGYLHLVKGNLVTAKAGTLRNIEAAFRIISWENTVIDIEKVSGKKKNEINLPLIKILQAGLKIKKNKNLLKDGDTAIKEWQKFSTDIETEEEEDLLITDGQFTDGGIEQIGTAKKSKKKWLLSISLVLLMAIVTVISLRTIRSMQDEKEYSSLLQKVESQQAPTDKLKILRNFISSNPKSKFIIKAKGRIKNINNIITEQYFKITMENADKFFMNKNYEKATTVYKQFLTKYPQNIHTAKIKKKIAEILLLIDDRDYQEIAQSSRDDIFLYIQYLEKHPKGKHRKEVKKIILSMEGKFYFSLKNKITICKIKEDWGKCIQLCDTYIKIYPDSERSDELKRLQSIFKEKLRDKRKLANLIRSAEQEGSNYQAAEGIFLDFLKSHPNTKFKDKILIELNKLKEREELARIQNEREKIKAMLNYSGGRFTDNQDGTLTDTKTGLMWTMLDSLLELQDCLDYKSAAEYVKNLKTGGYQDWRLPAESELTGIYKSEPFFPLREAKWYWTSKSYLYYSYAWQKLVHIVTTKRETVWGKETRDSRECGSVQAVRP